MEQRRNQRNRQPQHPAGLPGRGGFTLIEVMVVIAVLGALTAAISVNWASFIRHQELRQDAINLHKEILALKARAIEQGNEAMITFPKDGSNTYTITWVVTNDDNTANIPRSKTVNLNNGVTISAPTKTDAEGVVLKIDKNIWRRGVADPDDDAHVRAKAQNLDAYDEGRILIESNKAKARYYIQKDDATSIRPELYYQSKGNGKWTKM